MTFELSPEQQMARDQARAFAREQVQPQAVAIDRDASVPLELVSSASALLGSDTMSMILAVEEFAAVSAALALNAAAERSSDSLGLSGLRGAMTPIAGARSQLALAGVTLGLGKAALDAALTELKRAATMRGAGVEKPHWAVADAATELEAARLMTYKAAHTNADADVALARLVASAAAHRVVDAALRVLGPAGLQPGSVLERVSRDVRAAGLIAGTEEDQRTVAGEGLLPP